MKQIIWTTFLCLVLFGLLLISQPLYAQSVATVPPTNTKHATITTASTLTPTSTVTPTLAAIPAHLCSDCSRVRLRKTPGTAGDVLTFLDPTVALYIQGRSDDSKWVRVQAVGAAGEDGTLSDYVGWVAVSLVHLKNGQVPDDATIEALPILDVAVQAPPTPTSSIGVPMWMSGVSAHTHEIFVKGQQLGNRANVFSRVGDSMTVSPNFLTPFGQGQYDLGAYGSLSSIISYYSTETARTGNSFVNQSLAAGGGWSAFTLLQAGYSSPNICGQDSPLVCEYKKVKPAVALIMIGTNDSGSGSTGPFKGSLDEIIQTSIDMGVIPVLFTIPPKVLTEDQSARVDAFNEVIRSTAIQFDIPLCDYYTAMVDLPNKGMSSDGLHASAPPGGTSAVFSADNLQYGYTVRNLMALQALDIIKKLAMN